MQSRRAYFNAVANSLYQRGIKSHDIARLSRFVGENQSTKTILRRLRLVGVVRPSMLNVGLWNKKRKKRALGGVALAFSAWVNYVRSGGTFDLLSVLEGLKPP